MRYHWTRYSGRRRSTGRESPDRRLLADGGVPRDDEEEETDADEEETAADEPDEEVGEGSGGQSNVDVMDAGEAEPAEPEMDLPDEDDIPEFEVRAQEPVAGGGSTSVGTEAGDDPTAGRPNDARAPGATRISEEGTEAYVGALELFARLPEDIRLPEEAADLVPAAVEAELEDDVQQFAANEFDNPRPHVDTISFEEADSEIWLRIRLGVPPEDFADVDPEAIRTFALKELEGVL
jgi:hypothetical protein